MLFGGQQTRDEILEVLSNDKDAFENVIAMANVGGAFSQICILENSVATLILFAKVKLREKLDPTVLDASQLILDRHQQVRSSTLGRLVSALEQSGISGRDIRYLRKIVEIRNEFIHRFTEQVPLPGDWPRHGFTIERFSTYTKYVLKHLAIAAHFFPTIMIRHGLLAGNIGKGDFILWHPDDPFFGDIGDKPQL